MAADKISFYYFDSSGRGEVCRLLLAAGKANWDDVRFNGETWPQYKDKSPFGQAPYMNYKGTYCGQSVAMANFLAREFGFYGSDSLQQLRVDEVVCIIQDLFTVLIKMYYEKDEEKKAELSKKAKEEEIPKFFTFLENLVKQSTTPGYFVGGKLSLADFATYDAVENIVKTLMELKDADASYPGLQAVVAKVKADPGVSAYLQKRAEAKAKADAEKK